MFENLQQAKVIDRAFKWFEQEIARLNLTWEAIKGLFRTAWDSLSLSDVLNLSNAVAKVAQIFGPTLARLVNFASAAGRKVLEFILEGVLNSQSATLGTRVLAIIRRAGAVFSTIINDPIRFIGNLVAAVRGGFERFSENILDHLRTALMQWLFGALSGAGLTLPDRFDLRGIVSIVLQILGLTYDRLRAKLVGLIGEKNVARIEGAFDFLRTMVTGGLAAAWEKILEFAENLQEMVIGSIRDWVAKSVVGAAIKKLVTMFNPAGAIIQAIIAIYNTVVFFIERAQQIAALAEAVFDSISNIAAGNIGAAISYVERTMARALPVIIGFLARLIGLGNVGDHIRDIIKKVQAPVERAIDKVAGFVVQRAKSLLAVGIADLTPQQRLERALSAAQSAVNRFAGMRVGAVVLRPLLGAIKLRYGLNLLDIVARGERWAIRGVSNPEIIEDSPALVADGAGTTGDLEVLKSVVPYESVSYPLHSLNRAGGPVGLVKGVKAEEGRLPLSVRNLPGYQPGDHRGHLIGDRFYGINQSQNLVPMHEQLNLSTFKTYENALASKFNTHKEAARPVLLYMHIVPNYPSDDPTDPASFRPESVSANSKIITLRAGTASPTAEEESVSGSFPNPNAVVSDIYINTPDLNTLDASLRVLRLSPRLREAILSERRMRGRFGDWDYLQLRLSHALGDFAHLIMELHAHQSKIRY
jgi:hypothetical protein